MTDFTHQEPQTVGLPIRRVAAVVLVGLLAGFAMIQVADSRNAPVTGIVQAVMVDVPTPWTARIERMDVSLGDEVDDSTVIAVIRDDGLALRSVEAEIELQNSRDLLARATARSRVDLAWRLRELDSELLSLRLQSADQLERQFATELQREAWSDAAIVMRPVSDASVFASVLGSEVFGGERNSQRHLTATLLREATVNALEVNEARIELCDQRIKELEHLRNELPREVERVAGVDEAKAVVAAAEAEVDRLTSIQTSREVISRAFGQVGRVPHAVGDTLPAGEPIITIFDQQQRYITARVPVENSTDYAIGQELNVLFPGRIRMRGLVESIPLEATSSVTDEEPHVAIRIRPHGKLWPQVPVGTLVSVRPR